MTDSFVTQCPHCQTSFRVTHHQLSVARGVVRCGHCLQVFNAAAVAGAEPRCQRRASAGGACCPGGASAARRRGGNACSARGGQQCAQPCAGDDWAVTAEALDALDLDKELGALSGVGASAGTRRPAG